MNEYMKDTILRVIKKVVRIIEGGESGNATSTDINSYKTHTPLNKGGESYETELFTSIMEKHRSKIDFFKSNNVGPDEVILDVGCGYGALGYLFLRDVLGPKGRYVGVDVSAPRLRDAKHLMSNAGYAPELIRIKDINDCLKIEGVTLITIFSVFTHLFNEDISNYLITCNKALRPGGRLCFSILDMNSSKGLFYLNHMKDRNSNSRFKTEFYTIHSLDYIETLLKYSGFKIVNTQFLPPNIQRFIMAEKVEDRETLA